MRTDATLAVRADPRCVAAARRLVAERCVALGAPTDLGAVQLMVSELVTNVIRHTPDGDGELRVLLDRRALRVEVEDRGRGVPSAPVAPDRERGGGFGLYMVDRLADRWGVWKRNCVWFEVDLQPAEPSASAGAGSGRFERARVERQHIAA